MEASALPTRRTAGRAPLSAAFLRLRSDDQLVALFRAGSDDAFRAIHERYRGRLLAYTRQMLRGGASDPEDALQDVFMRAYRALRSSDRPVTLRAWLYRIAHNRCIDELRRPSPLPSELAPDAEPAFGAPRESGEPPAVAERSAALARLVADVRTLPSQQRSALLMRELQGLSYEELASALAVSVPAVKSLLLRARTGLIDIALARDTPCIEIRDELVGAADRGVRISGRARRHCHDCSVCDSYRGELKRIRRGFAALTPAGPLGQLGMLLGIGGGGGAAAAGGSGAVVGGGAAATGGGVLAGATVAKVAVALCCAALITTAGRAVIAPPSPPPARGHAIHRSVAVAPAPKRLLAATSPAPSPRAPAGAPGGSVAPGAAVVLGASGPTGPTADTGIAPAAPDGGATGSSGAVGYDSTGGEGATGTTAPGTFVNGIGAAGAASPPTGATGATGSAGDGHYDTTKSGATGGSGATIGASPDATAASAPGS